MTEAKENKENIESEIKKERKRREVHTKPREKRIHHEQKKEMEKKTSGVLKDAENNKAKARRTPQQKRQKENIRKEAVTAEKAEIKPVERNIKVRKEDKKKS